MSQSVADVQKEIDTLFEKLDVASTGGEIGQLNHALRVKVSRKRQLGGKLSEREKTLVTATGGEVDARHHKGVPWVTLVILAVVAVAGYFAYKTLGK